VAWVSLERQDNDIHLLWAYVINALQRIDAELGEDALAMLESPNPPPLRSILTTLINDIAARYPRSEETSCVLVLDDYHVINAREIHEGLSFFLERQPPGMHVVIVTRTDPPLALSRLRARNQLIELRAADLRFTPSETAAFLSHTVGLNLLEAQIDALDARTEGWIAGLQLVSLSIPEKDGEQASTFIADLADSNRYVIDYLVEEVLQLQPPHVQRFLLQTAILDRLNGSLCDAVVTCGEGDAVESGHEILERLDRTNLFVVPLDHERRWYRYHHLFGDLLRERLSRDDPALRSVLHHRASVWYEENGFVIDAIRHALAAEDVDRAADLVEGNVLVMLNHGELTTLAKWLDRLPEEAVRARPWLRVAHAWVLVCTGQLDDVDILVESVERDLGDLEEGTSHITGHLDAIRTYQAALKGNLLHTIEWAGWALKALPEEDTAARGLVMINLAFALRMCGDPAEAARILSEARKLNLETGTSQIAVSILCEQAKTHMANGHLREAYAMYETALQVAQHAIMQTGRELPIVGTVYSQMSMLLWEWHEMEEALTCARRSVEIGKKWALAELLTDSYIHLALILQTTGDEEGAMEAVRAGKLVACDLSGWYLKLSEAYEAWLRLLQGNVTAACHWAQMNGLSAEDVFSLQNELSYRLLAQVYLAQGCSDEARCVSGRLLRMAEKTGATSWIIRALILEAMALHAAREREQALNTLHRALRLAEPGDYVQSFLTYGKPMTDLLRMVAARGVQTRYVHRLLSAYQQDAVQQDSRTFLIDPLSKREIEVLNLLAAGLTNKEIGNALYIAQGTVKNHLQSIYSKLDVHNRTQAVTRGREMGYMEN
jgi:LuxR family maltose regulon positive regulatory protein